MSFVCIHVPHLFRHLSSSYSNSLPSLNLDRFILKCLSIGTPKTINFPFVPNGKLMVLSVPIFELIGIRLKCAQILGHLKVINFTFRTNENFIILVSQYLGTLR